MSSAQKRECLLYRVYSDMEPAVYAGRIDYMFRFKLFNMTIRLYVHRDTTVSHQRIFC